MSVELASEIWSLLKSHISSVDRQEAADELVSLLIDSDFSADDIMDDFRGDSYVKKALGPYFEHAASDNSYDEEDDDDDDDYYDDYDDEEDDEDY